MAAERVHNPEHIVRSEAVKPGKAAGNAGPVRL
jgi:hypothetical protein